MISALDIVSARLGVLLPSSFFLLLTFLFYFYLFYLLFLFLLVTPRPKKGKGYQCDGAASSLDTIGSTTSFRAGRGQPVGPVAASSGGGDIEADPSATGPVQVLGGPASWCVAA